VPIYDYACQSCGNRFERRQGFNDDPVAECPVCGGNVKRIIHPAGIVFKGSGFYKTDYASGKTGSSTDSGAEPSESSSKSESTPSTTPAPASTAAPSTSSTEGSSSGS
jgi:putative FmdB family regulatory protein